MGLTVLGRRWRYAAAFAVGAVVAVALGLSATKGHTSRFGVASKRVILDTPSSQTVDADPSGVATLEWRAGLLADLMGDDADRLQIARRMGIAGPSLVVSANYMSVPQVPVPLARTALEAAAAPAQPYQLAIQAADRLPIIAIDARAPTRADAARLATAAAETLKASAAQDPGAAEQQLVIEDVGPVRAREIVDRPRRLIAVGVAVVVLAAWCTGLLFVAGLARRRRTGGGPARLGPAGALVEHRLVQPTRPGSCRTEP